MDYVGLLRSSDTRSIITRKDVQEFIYRAKRLGYHRRSAVFKKVYGNISSWSFKIVA